MTRRTRLDDLRDEDDAAFSEDRPLVQDDEEDEDEMGISDEDDDEDDPDPDADFQGLNFLRLAWP